MDLRLLEHVKLFYNQPHATVKGKVCHLQNQYKTRGGGGALTQMSVNAPPFDLTSPTTFGRLPTKRPGGVNMSEYGTFLSS